MIKLGGKVRIKGSGKPFVVRCTRNHTMPGPARARYALVQKNDDPDNDTSGFAAVMTTDLKARHQHKPISVLLPEEFHDIDDGDVLRINPSKQEIRILYRASFRHNSILLTERCNSNCIMCSQPPRDIDDSYIIDELVDALPLFSQDTPEICFSGGEPMLLGERFVTLLEIARRHLPNTAVHVLSNGRLASYIKRAQSIANVDHPDLMFGIPLYSDLADRHDFVVQAVGAYDQTIRGIINFARCGVRIEIRVVMHAQTYERLPQLSRFIVRNLPFVSHVAFMGLEHMGYVKMNETALWVDPVDYQEELCDAVEVLRKARIRTSIYNLQLCVIDKQLWPYARQSISDWKNEYLKECEQCAVKTQCAGFFASTINNHSRGVGSIVEI